MEGKVRVHKDDVVKNPSRLLPLDSPLLVESGEEFVSRGAGKLKNSLERLTPDLTGKVCADIGASTGGFTHLMLTKNAAKVFAVDVGKGLLHWKLRQDERVVVLEGINGKSISPEITGEKVDILTMDVSFISATYILPQFRLLLKDGAKAICLIKPQFEVGRSMLGKGGIVKDSKAHRFAVERVMTAGEAAGLTPIGVMPSPVTGGDGNREFLICFVNGACDLPALKIEDISSLLF